jgi:hypothetical protein
VPGQRCLDDLVDHVCLEGDEGKKHDEGETKKAEEPGFVDSRVCGADYLIELTAVVMKAIDDEAWYMLVTV